VAAVPIASETKKKKTSLRWLNQGRASSYPYIARCEGNIKVVSVLKYLSITPENMRCGGIDPPFLISVLDRG
jgi:hypothetical protein